MFLFKLDQEDMPASVDQSFYTVYLSEQGIELRLGYNDYPNCHALHTSKSYESAQQFAQIAANHRKLPMRDQVEA